MMSERAQMMKGVLKVFQLHDECIYPLLHFISPRRLMKIILNLIPILLTTYNSNKRNPANTQTNHRENTLFHQLCKADEQLLYRATGELAPGLEAAGGIHVVPYYIDFVVGCVGSIRDWNLSGRLESYSRQQDGWNRLLYCRD